MAQQRKQSESCLLLSEPPKPPPTPDLVEETRREDVLTHPQKDRKQDSQKDRRCGSGRRLLSTNP